MLYLRSEFQVTRNAAPVCDVLRPIVDVLTQHRDESSKTDQLVDALFDELDRYRCGLVERERLLRDSENSAQQHRHEIAEQAEAIKQQHLQLDATTKNSDEKQAEIDELTLALGESTEMLEQVRQELEDNKDQEANESMLSESRDRNDSLRSQLDASQADCTRLNVQHDEQLKRIVELEQLEHEAPIHTDSDPDSERVTALELERDTLEDELELVRGRAGELREVIADQKRELGQQKREMSAELRSLREVAEHEEVEHAGKSKTPEPRPTPRRAERPRNSSGTQDPVVDSVMAQFAKLQKDVAERRQKKR